MKRFSERVVSLFCLLALWPQFVFALNQISIKADKVEIDQVIMHDAQATLGLAKSNVVTIETRKIELGQSRLNQAKIELTLDASTTARVQALTLETPLFDARNPTIELRYHAQSAPSNFRFQADVKQAGDQQWGTMQLSCVLPNETLGRPWQCSEGLYKTEQANIPFDLQLLLLKNGAEGEIRFKQAQFTDSSGLHAGEKITGHVKLGAQFNDQRIDWQGQINWEGGELFWQPFYIAQSGHRFDVSGSYEAPYLTIRKASLNVNGVGHLRAEGRINTLTKAFDRLHVSAEDVNFSGLYPMLIQPLVRESAFGNLNVSGKADWSFTIEDSLPKQFALHIEDATIEDAAGKFGFSNLTANIPWDYDGVHTISFGYSGGHLLNIPLGKTRLEAEVNRYSITAPQLTLPVMDGALQFEDVSAAWVGNSMVWHLKMDLKPISMHAFSQALGWPTMQGQIDGHIPLITYANEVLRMDGTMQFNMFKGMVGMSDLRIDRPIGFNPQLFANLTMRDIDLGELTRTFNFGSIEGKLEGDVRKLTLANWKPVYMDAVIQTADGPHTKKVSQRAVENITALGGEGTAAALQRTFLRFFKEFNYEKIGIRCELRQDVCKMGGVETTPTGFVIVKGKGAPSVNVNGYTQYVSWKDLLGRMKRITDGNTKAVVQ